MAQKIYFIGTYAEVAHHAAPIKKILPIEIVSTSEVIEKANRGDLAVFFSEHFDRFRDCVVRLKSKNVATLYMIDGILEWRNAWENREDEPACPWTMRPALAHKVACIGPSQIAMLNSWGNAAKTELVGVPRFDIYSRILNKHTSETKKANSDFRLLIMSAKCPGFTPEQIEKTIAGFAALKSWLVDNPQIAGRKIVPVWRLTGDLSDRLSIENQCDDLGGMELKEMLVDVDAVVTTPSTAMLEAMLMERPVALLDFNNSPHLVPAAWRITAATHFQKTIGELASPSPAKTQLQKYMLRCGLLGTENAADRFVELVKRMLAAVELDSDQPIEFPANLIGDLSVTSNDAFDLSQLFPNFAEFKEAGRVELQSQLAHSRREIKHLQREIAQLQSELGQAHEIFEQIQSHPIAGPVVRIRQKLIEWMARFKTPASTEVQDVSNSSEEQSVPTISPESKSLT